jgi:protein-tyrosine phosphatase
VRSQNFFGLEKMIATIRSRFGTHRGLVRLALAVLENRAGALDQFKYLNWSAVDRVVFVCRGNICRSAYAEARARELGLVTASFGLSTSTGGAAYKEVVEEAMKRGIALGVHRSTDAKDFEVRKGDLLIAMEPRQARELLQRFATASCQFTLLGLWSAPIRPHIHDPYGLSREYLCRCLNLIDSAVASLARQVHADA